MPLISMQLRDVDEVQDRVVHDCLPIAPIKVAFAVAKLSPRTVSSELPSIGPFDGSKAVSVGASYVKTCDEVSKNTLLPRLEGIVTPAPIPTPTPSATMQSRRVADIQDVDRHKDAPIATVGEVFTAWKPKPVTPRTVPPEVGAFTGVMLATSIETSYEKHPTHGLPLLLAMIIVESIATLAPGGALHVITVALSHEDVLQTVLEPLLERTIVGERSIRAKFTPETVMLADPADGLLGGAKYENSGPSKLKSSGDVPIREPTRLTYEFS